MGLNKAQYSLKELQIFPTYATPEEYKAATGKEAPWDPTKAPKYWFDPAAEAQLAASPATKRYKTYFNVLAVNETNGLALSNAAGEPYFDSDPLILPMAEAAAVNIPPAVSITSAVAPAVQCPMCALDADEVLAWGGIGGVVVVRNKSLWETDVVDAATTFMPSDRATLKAIAAKLGVVVGCLLLLLVASMPAAAQTSFYVGGGPSFYSATSPHLAGNLTVGLCTASTATCSLTSVEARGSSSTPGELVYATQTGIKQRLATVQGSMANAELFTVAQAGASVTASATSGIAGLGGGVLFRPSKHPNWSIAFIMRAVYAPANPGWQPWGGVHLGYVFRTAAAQ